MPPHPHTHTHLTFALAPDRLQPQRLDGKGTSTSCSTMQAGGRALTPRYVLIFTPNPNPNPVECILHMSNVAVEHEC
jgi:hypothetical protein